MYHPTTVSWGGECKFFFFDFKRWRLPLKHEPRTMLVRCDVAISMAHTFVHICSRSATSSSSNYICIYRSQVTDWPDCESTTHSRTTHNQFCCCYFFVSTSAAFFFSFIYLLFLYVRSAANICMNIVFTFLFSLFRSPENNNTNDQCAHIYEKRKKIEWFNKMHINCVFGRLAFGDQVTMHVSPAFVFQFDNAAQWCNLELLVSGYTLSSKWWHCRSVEYKFGYRNYIGE